MSGIETAATRADLVYAHYKQRARDEIFWRAP